MQDDRYPFAPLPMPGDTAKPRRRHRSRSRGGARPAVQADPNQRADQNQNQGQNQNRPQARPAAPAEDHAQTPGGRTASGRHRRRGGGQGQAPVQSAPRAQQMPAQNAPQAQRQSNMPGPANTPRPQQQSRRAPAAPPRNEDPGLPLISRRPPKQKFANFEEYIAAHGGVTAPLPGEATEHASE